MKARHQIKFNRRRPNQPPKKKGPTIAKLNDEHQLEAVREGTATSKVDIVRTRVTVGERQLCFARALSDTEKEVREASLQSLTTWLTDNAHDMNNTEMDRLWKGLFYCVWMADKRPVITSVINDIVNLADIVGWPFLSSLYSTLMREWFGIDRHRVDKYYELVNKSLSKCTTMCNFYTAETYEDLSKGMEEFLQVLCERVWQPSRKCGVGLALHILDAYIDIVLKPALKMAGSKGIGCGADRVVKVFNMLTEDIFTMMGARNGWLPSISRRIQDRIIGRLVNLVQDDDIGLSRVMQRRIVDKAGKQVFKVASDKATEDKIRKELYDLHIKLKTFVHECETAQGDEVPDQDQGENVKETTVDKSVEVKTDGNGQKKEEGENAEKSVKNDGTVKRKERKWKRRRSDGQKTGTGGSKSRQAVIEDVPLLEKPRKKRMKNVS